MRAILTGVLALIFVLSSPAFSLAHTTAHDGGTAPVVDPDLAGLKSAIEQFRTELATLREACAEAGQSAPSAECRALYTQLREQFQSLKQQAMALVRRLHEWRDRSKDEQQRLANEADKEAAQKKEQTGLEGKSLQEKLGWLENRMLQLKVDLDLFQQRAKDARAQAEQLTGDAREEALAIAEKWEHQAADYAHELKKAEAQRQSLLAAIANANKPKTEPKKTFVGDAEKLAKQLKSLDDTIAYKRSKVAELKDLLAYKLAQADATTGDVRAHWLELAKGVQADIEKWTAYLNDLLAQRKELLAALENAGKSQDVKKAGTVSDADKLAQQLKSLDDTIAYKRSKIAGLRDVLAYKLARADATTGDERAQWLELAKGVQAEIDQWTVYLNDLLKQRAEVVAKMNGTQAATSYRDELMKKLQSLDNLVTYKKSKIAEAQAAGDHEGVQNWTALLNEVLAQRAEVVAKLAALPK